MTSSPGSRQVLQYGARYLYPTRGLGEAPALPEYLRDLIPLEKGSHPWEQLLVNRYRPGQNIAAHIDHTRHFGGCIACISLGATAVVEFAPVLSGPTFQYVVEDGSLYVMTGAARYEYSHRVSAPESKDRVSLTYRTLGPNTSARVLSPSASRPSALPVPARPAGDAQVSEEGADELEKLLASIASPPISKSVV